VKRQFEATKDAVGRLDILVNNAGVFNFTALEQVTEEDFRRQFDANVLGTILTISVRRVNLRHSLKKRKDCETFILRISYKLIQLHPEACYLGLP
jgi:NAD(P)-dependent dehydrogenase (short-subunit alcohol dehydrogenase family)